MQKNRKQRPKKFKKRMLKNLLPNPNPMSHKAISQKLFPANQPKALRIKKARPTRKNPKVGLNQPLRRVGKNRLNR